MISREEIRGILSESRSMALPEDAGNDSEFVMDSFTMVVLEAALEERHGIRLDSDAGEMQFLSSVNQIHDYLSRRFPEHVAP